jgi:phosphoribosylformylglycinamidine synthase
MSQTLRLRGRNALSAFRSSRLVHSLRSAVPRVTDVHAEYWHFVELERALSDAEARRLDRVLAYGPAGAAGATRGELMLVVQGD